MKEITIKWFNPHEWQKGRYVFAIKKADTKGDILVWDFVSDSDAQIGKEKGEWLYLPIRSIPKSPAKQIYEAISRCLKDGYTLDEKAQKQYEYWGKRFAAELEEEYKRKLEEQQRFEKKVQALPESQMVLWCYDDDCITKLSICKQCKRYFQGCRPENKQIKRVGNQYAIEV